MRLRPHHLLDIITDYGHAVEFRPHPYGHAVHIVAAQVLANLDLEVRFVLAADEICRPCQHLRSDGQCGDVLHQLGEPISKQAYNDALDCRLFSYFGMRPGDKMTWMSTSMRVRTFLEKVSEHMPGVEKMCTHPGEKEKDRLEGLEKGLTRLGFRECQGADNSGPDGSSCAPAWQPEG